MKTLKKILVMWMYKDKEAYYKRTGIDRRVR